MDQRWGGVRLRSGSPSRSPFILALSVSPIPAERLRSVECRNERVASEQAGQGIHGADGILASCGDVAANAAEGLGAVPV